MTHLATRRPDWAWFAGWLALACLGSTLAFYRLGGIALLDPDEAHVPYMLGLIGLCVPVALVSGRLDARRFVVPIFAASVAALLLFLVRTEDHKLENQRSAKGIVQETRIDQRPEVRLCVYKKIYPSLLFYAHRQVETAGDAQDLRAFLREPGDAVVLMPARRVSSLQPDLRSALEPLAARGSTVALMKHEAPPAAAPEPSPHVR